jgi:aminopeptidase
MNIQPGELLFIRSSPLAIPLVREVYREALRAASFPQVRISMEEAEQILYAAASDEQLDYIFEGDKLEVESADARLTINAPTNTRANSGVDPVRQARRGKALNKVQSIFRRRSTEGSLKWCGTLFPTNALAQEAGMSLAEYEQFVYSAMFLDRDDPAAAWLEFSKEQQKKADFLENVKTLRIVAKDTDLTLSVAGRHWMNSDGKRNFPSGEVFTGPIEDSANGVIRFTFPAIAGGREIEDVVLQFESGKVVKATAARGQDYLDRMLDSDRGARYLGEVAVGNNYNIQRFTKNTLFDEKIGGTCHLAVGASYGETGGKNESAIHWDMVCDLRQGGEIQADGQVIHRNGQWLI